MLQDGANGPLLAEVLTQLRMLNRRAEPSFDEVGTTNKPADVFRRADDQPNEGRLARRLLRAIHRLPRNPSNRKLSGGSWNMLLELAASHEEYQRLSVTALTAASGEPPTTALRHLDALERDGLVERERDPRDQRRVFMVPSAAALTLVSSAIRALRRALW